MGKLIDLTGQKFGRLTVIKRSGHQGKIITWKCLCECGKECVVRADHIRDRSILSCGCLTREKRKTNATKHSMSKTKLYRTYIGMKNRCYDKKHKHYNNYGGRGITICEEWLNDRSKFFEWALLHGYTDDLMIDRINNDKGYSPDNCRWVTRQLQNNNTRKNRYITYNGKTRTIAQWAKDLKFNYGTLYSRINKLHWSIEKALNTP